MGAHGTGKVNQPSLNTAEFFFVFRVYLEIRGGVTGSMYVFIRYISFSLWIAILYISCDLILSSRLVPHGCDVRAPLEFHNK